MADRYELQKYSNPDVGSQSNEKYRLYDDNKGKLTSDFVNKLYFDKFKYTKLLSLNYFKYTITKKIAKLAEYYY